MTTDRVPRPCTHTPERPHGTMHRYKTDGCRCRPCTDAARRYEKHRETRILSGTWRPYAPADPVRAHVAALAEQGIGYRRVGDLAGVTPAVMQRLLYGESNRPPSGRIRAANAAAILAVTATGNHAPHALVPATGTRRRLQALHAIGWDQRTIARRLGMGDSNYRRVLLYPGQQSVHAETAAAVRDLYRALWATPGPSPAARDRAAARGWVSPLAWDDDTIDDPHAQPQGVTGIRRTRDDWLADVAEMAAQGRSVAEVCARIGSKPDAVERRLYRYGRADLWRALRDPDTRMERTA